MKNATYVRILAVVSCVIVSGLFGARYVLASSVTLQSDEDAVYRNESVTVSVLLNPESESVNTVKGTIEFDRDLFSLAGVNTSNSVVSSWITAPTTDEETIDFAGLIPKGFAGVRSQDSEDTAPGTLFSFTLEPRRSGAGTVTASNLQAFSKKGQKTRAESNTADIRIKSARMVTTQQNPSNDSTDQSADTAEVGDNSPPRSFSPQIIRPSSDCGSPLFAAFQTTDTESGVDHYEIAIADTKPSTTTDLAWKQTESPHRITDLEVDEWVAVKAVDVAGNERVGVVQVSAEDTWPSRCQKKESSNQDDQSEGNWLQILLIASIAVTALLIVYQIFLRKHN